MSTSSFRTGEGPGDGLLVEVAADGLVLGVRAVSGPAADFLASAGGLTAERTGSGPVAWSEPTVSADVDELEVVRSCGDLRATLRHTFDGAWTVRLVLANAGAEPVALDDVVLGWVPGPDVEAVALAAGASGTYALAPASGAGPVLAGTLLAGTMAAVDEDALHLGPLRLTAGQRYVTQWRWTLADSPADVGGAARLELPRALHVDATASVLARADPDVAFVAPGLGLDPVGDQLELSAPSWGRYPVEVRDARGVTAYELAFAPDLDDLVEAVADRLLAGPRSAGGVVRLPGVAAGLVLQHALARRAPSDSATAEDALEVFAAELAETTGLDALAVALLAQEADRTGDRMLLDRAGRALLETSVRRPGLGLAATRVCLTRVQAGLSIGDVTRHLVGLAALPPDRDRPGDDPAARVELGALTRPRDAPEPGPDDPLTAALRVVGAGLGAGLTGQRVRRRPPDWVAYRAAVLGLVPEDVGHRMRDWWGASAADVAREAAAEVRSALADRLLTDRPVDTPTPDGSDLAALAWLVLGAAAG